MFGFDPRFIGFLCVLFVALGIFNIVRGRRQLLAMRARGIQLAWYKHTGLLVGIEYVLLGIVFLTSLGLRYGVVPDSFRAILNPFYLVMLLASAALAGVVIFQGMSNRRRAQVSQMANASTTSTQNKVETEDDKQEAITPEQRALQIQKRRERRQKAAQARRRRAGKA
jgi:hypothetical protein